jgi:acid phosphatase
VRRLLPLVAVVLACAPAATAPAGTPAPPPAAAAAPALPNDVHWTRNSAEHLALFVQTYRLAGDALREAASGLAMGTWAVILDGDETVLDNSTYQKRRAEAGLGYTQASWDAWVEERTAGALPGGGEFIALARGLGGRVVIVTNRTEATCPATRDNLRTLGIAVDLVLCNRGVSDKNPRFGAVADGTASPELPAVRVLMWVGDNVQDFPSMGQDVRNAGAGALDAFGRRFVLLPNPMYGSWTGNPKN